MRTGLQPYSRYHESGIPWVGRLPEHWRVMRGKSLFAESRLPVKANDEIVTCFRDGQVTLRRNRRTSGFMIALKEAGYQGVRRGQLVIHAMDAFAGAIGVSDSDGKCTPEYIVCKPRLEDISPTYYARVLRLAAHSDFIQVSCPAVRERAPRLRYPNFGAMALPVPPPDEQAAIVRFIGHADRLIRHYIRAKQRLIALLDEQKRTIIHRAVTRGLDPDVRLKSSNLSTLEDIPQHWDIQRLKDVASVRTGLTLGKVYRRAVLKSFPYLRVANVQAGHLDLREVKHVSIPCEEAGRVMLQPEDVLMTEGGDIDKLGRGCVWTGEILDCLHQNHVFAVRCKRLVLLPAFLVGLMTSQHGRVYFQLTAKKTTNLASTNRTTLRAFPVVLPPVREQRVIVNRLQQWSERIGQATGEVRREIDLLREFRTRLIADVVTGKLDVRAVAATLPDILDDSESLLDDNIETESESNDE